MTQLEFIPLRITEYKPNPRQTTQHQTGVALCDDGLRYFVKGMGGEVDVCATEWICTSFARSLNLPVPPMKVLQTPGGALVFGSQAITHCMSDLEASMLLLDGPGNLNVPGIRNLLSATYAFDQLIYNPDRHDHNFLFQRAGLIDGQEIANLHIIDFGSSTILNDNSIVGLAQGMPTVQVGKKIRKVHGFSVEFARSFLDRFHKGRALICDNAMIGLPTEWLSKNARTSLITRILSPEFGRQIDEVGEGIRSGAYL
ncbi:HipA family kinase [Mesorhizobium sp. LSHC412B00]|uniref:HipA family kinase n=1 Tax=Mesorhizobium sp. LSHC412B00 TaxID=1287285 RepID=UPI0003CDFEC6|nr:HipA family kinase [Mesorhizobium sp. LSHC412B00]ESX85518.1 hypothetical protein X756_21425 [Mesorhizobium sp. LSHC412B00]